MEALDNLVKINQLKQEPPDQVEFDAMVNSASAMLRDANVKGLSINGQFSLAYGAAHSLALAALRWQGYRSDKRYIVFQCLQHTLGISASEWRVFDLCHKRRNIAEYEGHLDIDNRLLADLLRLTAELEKKVAALSPVGGGK